LSLADFTGAIEGLLHPLPSMGHRRKLETLFDKYGLLAGVSGGSWTTFQLVYSEKYAGLVERSAALPAFAGAMWSAEYLVPWLNVFNANITLPESVLKCVNLAKAYIADQVLPWRHKSSAERGADGRSLADRSFLLSKLPWLLQVLAEAVIVLQTGNLSWKNFIETLFLRGAGIPPDLGLGTTDANAWAKGKTSLAVTGVVTPPGQDPFAPDDDWAIGTLQEQSVYATHRSNITYAGEATERLQPSTLPASFSIVVGAGTDAEAPNKFCWSPLCLEYQPQYKKSGTNLGDALNFSSDVWGPAFDKYAGMVPVSSASAASSAFKAQMDDARQACVALSVWTTNKGKGESFQNAEDLRAKMFGGLGGVNQQLAMNVTMGGMQPLIDGGFNDLFGIAHAVAFGATEVLAFMDVDVTFGPNDSGLNTLFRGTEEPSGRIIFESPTAANVSSIYAALPRIYAKPGSKWLKSIAYGTVADCVTWANPLYGLESGTRVKLNVLAIETINITIGMLEQNYTFNSLANFGQLVGEIAESLAGSEATRTILQDFFL